MTTDGYAKNSMSLLEYMTNFGVPRAHIARMTGISRCYLSNMLSGRDPMTANWIEKALVATHGYVSRERCAEIKPNKDSK